MHFRIYLFICLSLIAFSVPAQAFTGFVQYSGQGGTIAWGDGMITIVRGIEKNDVGEDVAISPLSVRKATSMARKEMLDMILSTRINSRQTVSSYISNDSEIYAQVRGRVHNSLFQGPGMFDEAGTVRVSEMFRDKLADLILPKTIQFQSGIPPKLSTSMEQRFDFTEHGPESAGSAEGYTGVIVDARGLKVTPALVPVVYGQDGHGAYGAFSVSRGNAVKNGLVAYAQQMDIKVLKNRTGNNPLVVKALSAHGSWRTDLIISSPMAKLVRAIMKNKSAAENCRVVIVLDKPKIQQSDFDKDVVRSEDDV